MERKIKKKKWKSLSAYILLFLVFAVFLASCKGKSDEGTGVEVRIETLPGQNGESLEIPVFSAKDGRMQDSLGDLEKETRKLEKICERAQRKGDHLQMKTSILLVDGYPQTNTVWYAEKMDTRFYNFVTLCADEEQMCPITCKDALERAGLTGVDLTLKVGKLYQEKIRRGQLTDTEMQGFRIGAGGEVEEIYMKLTVAIDSRAGKSNTGNTSISSGFIENLQEEERIEEHFFSYLVGEEDIVKLSERGFDVP